MGDAIRIDPHDGAPTIDLRRLEQKGLLHIVRKVTRHETRSSGATNSSESKTVSIELYSALEAAAILGRYLALEKRPPETEPPMLAERNFVLGILESGDPKARALLEEIARKVLP
jgi:hypothetical protein